MGLYCYLSSQIEEIPNSSPQTSEFQINPVSAVHKWPWGFSPWVPAAVVRDPVCFNEEL